MRRDIPTTQPGKAEAVSSSHVRDQALGFFFVSDHVLPIWETHKISPANLLCLGRQRHLMFSANLAVKTLQEPFHGHESSTVVSPRFFTGTLKVVVISSC